ncbi:unnamed protein product, partial [marine sediment metagenome]
MNITKSQIIIAGIALVLMESVLLTAVAAADINAKVAQLDIDTSTTIVPLIRVGDYKLGMSKDDVLKSLGKPKMIFYSRERYTLENLPRKYFMVFDDISFGIVDDFVEG